MASTLLATGPIKHQKRCASDMSASQLLETDRARAVAHAQSDSMVRRCITFQAWRLRELLGDVLVVQVLL
eukprot:6319953-Pyramimonas_sp.AAC.1